jgi:hypothetical protein
MGDLNMWTPQEVQAFNSAYRSALASVNANAKHPILDNKTNFAILVGYLRREKVEESGWIYPQIWSSSIVATMGQLEKEPPPLSPQEIARLNEARDRKDGMTFRDDSAPTTKESFRETVLRQAKTANGLLDRIEDQKRLEQRREIPGPEATAQQQKQMTATELKIWLQRYGKRKPQVAEA